MKLPDFKITEEEMEEIVNTPIEDAAHLLIKILPDTEKPSKFKRVIMNGLALFELEYGRSYPKSRLAQVLLYLFFTDGLDTDNQLVNVMSNFDYDDDEEDGEDVYNDGLLFG